MNDRKEKEQNSGVRDQEIRAALDQHWAASDANGCHVRIKEDRGSSAWLGVSGYQRKSSRGGVNTWTSSASSMISMLCSMFAGMA
jgi:hypothetical protein